MSSFLAVSLLILITKVLFHCSGCFCQCITYTPLEYNEDIPLNEPLGYSTATLPNPDDVDLAEICVTVDVGPQGSLRNIEVQAENTNPLNDNRICIQQEEVNEFACGQSQSRYCQSVLSDNTVTFTFSCDNSCIRSAVNFYYRFVLSPLSTSEDLEYWCDNRIPNQTYQYPSGLTNSQFTDYSVETLATTTEADNNNSQFTDYSAETLATTTEAAGSPSLYQLTWPALLLSLIVMLSQ